MLLPHPDFPSRCQVNTPPPVLPILKSNVQQLGADSVVDVDNLEVAATVTNVGDEVLKILNDPSSVLSNNFATDSFAISSDGGAPRFIGAKVKYVPEQVVAKGDANSFTVLAPGESITVSHNREFLRLLWIRFLNLIVSGCCIQLYRLW